MMGRLSAQSEEALATAGQPAAEPSLEAPGRNIIFGTRENQKSIAKLAAGGFIVAGLLHLAIAWKEPTFSIPALLFSACHGALLGMLIGQLAWVYPDRVILIFACAGALAAEFICLGATGRLENFQLDRETFQAILALAFWFGFIGFWLGFILFAKRLEANRRWRQHLARMEEDRAVGEVAGPEAEEEAEDQTPAETAPEAEVLERVEGDQVAEDQSDQPEDEIVDQGPERDILPEE